MNVEQAFSCSYPFGEYLMDLTANLVLLFNEDQKLIQCNERFRKLSTIEKSEFKDRKIEDLFISDNPDFPDLPDENDHVKVSLQLSELVSEQNDHLFTSYLFNTGDYYCLIGEEQHTDDQEVLEKITLLNNALSNKARKLTKKNKELEKAYARIEKLSRTDTLTDLANRRHFMSYFDKILSQAQRHDHPLSLAMLDLDKFKDINDKFGHQAGDEVLSNLGELLKEKTRKEDLAGRIGGEEFAVLLTQADSEDARSYAERTRNKITEMEIDSISTKVTASFGISTLKEDDDQEYLMKRADRALYEAKAEGRNRVKVNEN